MTPPEPLTAPIDIVFSGDQPNLTFVEVETTNDRESLRAGQWSTDENGHHRLTIQPADLTGDALHKLAQRGQPFSLHHDPQTDPYMGDWTLEVGPISYEGFDPLGAVAFATEETAKP